jgi:Uma2 family endonuclease
MTVVTTAPTRPSPVTPEDMLRLSDDGRLYELVDGRLVEKEMSDLAQFVANRLKRLLDEWCVRSGAGAVLVEATYQCFAHAPEMVRRPDVSFISSHRLRDYAWGRGHFTIAPDLAAEVVSPRDEVYELDRKIADYFRAGVRRVWVINPEQQTVRTHRAPGDLAELVGAAELADDAVLPGFRCQLSALFAPPQ